MKTRKMVSLSISIVSLIAAVILAYLAFQRLSGSTGGNKDAGRQSSLILPQGRELNFDTVSEFNKSGTIYPYPQAIPSEIGIEPGVMTP